MNYKNITSIIVLLNLFLLVEGDAQTTSNNEANLSNDSLSVFNINSQVNNEAFKVGESLKFLIRYGPIQAGYAYLEILQVRDVNGRRCFEVTSRAESNNFFSTFYKVRDKTVSLMDSVGLYSWHFSKKIREGKYRADIEVIFDQPNYRVITKKDTIKTPAYVQDPLSSLYFLRTQNIEVGKSYFIDHFSGKKLYPLTVRVLRKETIRVRAGKFTCLVVEPVLKDAGVFNSKGDVTVWLTDDRYRIPVLMKSKILVGSIIAELIEYKGVLPSG